MSVGVSNVDNNGDKDYQQEVSDGVIAWHRVVQWELRPVERHKY